MARLHILELPEGSGDERPPFILVVDQYEPQRYILDADQPEPVDQFQGIAEKIGARAVLVFEDTIDIPANDTTAYLGSTDVRNEVTLKLGDQEVRDAIAADMQKMRDVHSEAVNARDKDAELRAANEWIERLHGELNEARMWARHGYEISQKHCGWTDHGVAPHWLTEDWPPHIESCEHLKHAAALDEALCSIRSVHAPVDHRGQIICKECSGLDSEGRSTDNAPVLHEQCRTSRIACTAQSSDA